MSQDESSRDESVSFQYFLADKKPTLIVTFVGSFDFFAVEALLKCKDEITNISGIKFVVFHFRDVDRITGDAIGVFTKMQIELRSRSCELSICSLRPPLRQKLINMGVVRLAELSNNLREALLAFIPQSAGGTRAA